MGRLMLFEAAKTLCELKNLRRTISKQAHFAKKYDGVSLVASNSKSSSNTYYYLRQRGVKGKRYLGNMSNKNVIAIQEARFYSELLHAIDTDISLLESLSTGYILTDREVINNRLPQVYRNPNLSVIAPIDHDAAEWKRRKEAEKATHPVFRPEDLKHTAIDGTKMRSLSEVLIANYLISLGITFVYELPLIHHGKRIYPDFTILSPIDNKTEIIIEHQGAMDSENYQAKFIRTLLFYLQTELVPNKDVFFTFNHLNRNPDLKQIDSILRIAFGLEVSPAALAAS